MKPEEKPTHPEKSDATRGAYIQGILGIIGALIGALIGAVALIYAVRITQTTNATATAYIARSDATQTSLIGTINAPTDTPLPTQTRYPTYTAQPTYTPNPTYTPRPNPTNTPFPTPTEVALFQDNFDNGLSDGWKIESGNPIIVNNALTFDQKTLMAVGESSWTNYVVTFETSNLHCQWAVYDNAVVIGIRYQDANNMIALRWSVCRGNWSIVENGQWREVPNTNFTIPAPFAEGVRRPEVTASGNTFKVNGGPSIVIANYPSGRVAILADPTVIIDNFVVSAVP